MAKAAEVAGVSWAQMRDILLERGIDVCQLAKVDRATALLPPGPLALCAVVLVHGNGDGYEVEFVSLDGETVAFVSLYADLVRPIGGGEIAHARPLHRSLNQQRPGATATNPFNSPNPRSPHPLPARKTI